MRSPHRARSHRPIGTVLAFVAGAALGLPLVSRPTVIGPVCNTVTQGDQFVLSLVSATRDAQPIMPPAGFQGTVQNAAARDDGLLNAHLYLDAGAGSPGPIDRAIRRIP